MIHKITRIPISQITYEAFVRDYLIPEKPIILTNINTYNKEEITSENVKKLFQSKSKLGLGCYKASIYSTAKIIPPLLHEIIRRKDMTTRLLAMRIFMAFTSTKFRSVFIYYYTTRVVTI